MATTYNELCQFINDAGFDVCLEENNEDETRVCYHVSVIGTLFEVYVHLREQGRELEVLAFPRPHEQPGVSDNAIDHVQELLNYFNNDIRYGRWSVDEDGDSNVHFSFILEDAPLTRRQLARFNHLLIDLMIHQAQMLQIQAKSDRCIAPRLFGLSAAAVQAVVDAPEQIDVVLQAIHATEQQAYLLHDVIGSVYTTSKDELSDLNEDGQGIDEAADACDTLMAVSVNENSAKGAAVRSTPSRKPLH